MQVLSTQQSKRFNFSLVNFGMSTFKELNFYINILNRRQRSSASYNNCNNESKAGLLTTISRLPILFLAYSSQDGINTRSASQIVIHVLGQVPSQSDHNVLSSHFT